MIFLMVAARASSRNPRGHPCFPADGRWPAQASGRRTRRPEGTGGRSGSRERSAATGHAPSAMNLFGLGFQVTRNKLGHLEHRNALFAIEHGLELIISVNLSPDFGILKFVLFDVVSKFLRQLSTRDRFCSNHCRQEIIRLYRLEEGGVGFAGRFLFYRLCGFLNGFLNRFFGCHRVKLCRKCANAASQALSPWNCP